MKLKKEIFRVTIFTKQDGFRQLEQLLGDEAKAGYIKEFNIFPLRKDGPCRCWLFKSKGEGDCEPDPLAGGNEDRVE